MILTMLKWLRTNAKFSIRISDKLLAHRYNATKIIDWFNNKLHNLLIRDFDYENMEFDPYVSYSDYYRYPNFVIDDIVSRSSVDDEDDSSDEE